MRPHCVSYHNISANLQFSFRQVSWWKFRPGANSNLVLLLLVLAMVLVATCN